MFVHDKLLVWRHIKYRLWLASWKEGLIDDAYWFFWIGNLETICCLSWKDKCKDHNIWVLWWYRLEYLRVPEPDIPSWLYLVGLDRNSLQCSNIYLIQWRREMSTSSYFLYDSWTFHEMARIEIIYRQIVLWDPLWSLNTNFWYRLLRYWCNWSNNTWSDVSYLKNLEGTFRREIICFVLFNLDIVIKINALFVFAEKWLLTRTYAL